MGAQAGELQRSPEVERQGIVAVLFDRWNSHLADGVTEREEPRRAAAFRGVRIDGKVVVVPPPRMGDVPFAGVPAVLAEIGYREMPTLEVISRNPDHDILESAKQLAALGYSWPIAGQKMAGASA